MSLDLKKETRFLEILKGEKEFLSLTGRDFVTCTELGMDIGEWLEYCKWKNDGIKNKESLNVIT